jgi:hypothetical protein
MKSTPCLIRFPGAIDTKRRRRVEFQPPDGNFFITTHTIAIVTGRNSPQCNRDFLQFNLAASIPFPGHRLTLQGIHSRQAPDAGLIKFDSPCRLISRFLQTEQGLLLLQQLSSEALNLVFVHRRMPIKFESNG